MRQLRAWLIRLAGLMTARRRARDFETELQSHLQMHIEENIRRGMPPEEARRDALAAAGGLQAARDVYRDRGGVPLIETIGQDVRFAARMLRKSPGFTAAAVLVLALGIGANIGLFSLINAVLLRPIVPGAPELVGLHSGSTTRPDAFRPFSYPEYVEIRERRDAFEQVIAEASGRAGLTENGLTTRVSIMRVSSNYFSALGLALAAGRAFTDAEERPGSSPAVAIVSHAYWRRHGLAPDVVGRTIVLNRQPLTIVGVAPERFHGTMPVLTTDVWMPLGAADVIAGEGEVPISNDRSVRTLLLYATLKPGISIDDAQSRLRPLATALAAAHPEFNRDQTLVVHARSRTGRGPRPRSDTEPAAAATLLMAIASLVLLVACINVANMLLARGSLRRQEIAIRLALGGSRLRILRQLLVEGLLLAVMSGVVALGFGWWTASSLLATVVDILPTTIFLDPSPDERVVAAVVTACILSTLIFALGPAWKLSRRDVVSGLKQGGAPGSLHARRGRLPGVLVAVQVALSLALLIAAGAFMRGSVDAARADSGFPLEGGVLAETDARFARLSEAEARSAYRRILEELRAMPGVRAASVASIVPMGPSRDARRINRATQTEIATFTVVGAAYFSTLGVRVLNGREFTTLEERGRSADGVVIVDEVLARRLFPAGDALGQVVRIIELDESRSSPVRIVGVVAPVRNDVIAEPGGQAYVPFGQQYFPMMTVHVRTAPGQEAAMLEPIRRAIHAADNRLPVLSIKTMTAHRDTSAAVQILLFASKGFAAFGIIALLLAAAGVYGLRAYFVAQRGREIAIRMALGATRRRVTNELLRDGTGVAALGMAAGLLLALALVQVLRQSEMLYEVRTFDPVIFGAAVSILGTAVLGASYIPTRRAVRIDPADALRPD